VTNIVWDGRDYISVLEARFQSRWWTNALASAFGAVLVQSCVEKFDSIPFIHPGGMEFDFL